MLAWAESTATEDGLGAALAGSAAGGGAFAPARLARLDEREEFPDAECALLDDWGLASAYVPADLGGDFTDLASLVGQFRCVARHDLTTAVAHGKTFLGAVCAWVAGERAQAAGLAAAVVAGEPVCWGLTEPGHGSDLLACEVSARPDGDGWVIDGAKWMVNNATRAPVACVLARTAATGGPRGLSLFLVDRRGLAPGTWECLPKIRTHGVRGADISGVAFRSARVPADALVGTVGGGFETVLKALQLTRIFAVGLSLGAADHALAIAVDYARERVLYGRRLADLPRVRRVLGEAAAAALVADAVTRFACRAAHVLPDELPVISAVTKAVVPTLVQESIDALAELMGARGFLTDAHAHGAFAKLDRDHRVVSIFDGSTLVNRSALIGHFPALARASRADRAGVAAAVSSDPLPALDWHGLRLTPSGHSAVRGLRETADRVRAMGAPPPLVASADWLAAEADAVLAEISRPFGPPVDLPAAAFRVAERYELCFAGAVCLAGWVLSPRRDARASRAALAAVLARLAPDRAPVDVAAFDAVADALLDGQVPTGNQEPAHAR